MAAHLLFGFRRRIVRRDRVFRERYNPLLTMNDTELIARYRFPRASIESLIGLLRDDLESQSNRSHPLSVETKVLVTLRYLAKGDFFSEVGDLHGVSKASVSRLIETVLDAINLRLNNIVFPAEGPALERTKREFFRVAGIPNIVGTLIPILAPPGDDEDAYVCRKGYHAINVQAVADMTMRFTDVVAKWPGSQHDASIFDNSAIKEHIIALNSGWLLGDSGYPLTSYLVTPKLNPVSQAEVAYNTAHSRSRMIVERAFGLLKSRFRCLHKTGGCLPFKPGKCTKVAMACMRLHNKCIDENVPAPADLVQDDDGDNEECTEDVQPTGQQVRQRLINLFA